MSSNIEERILGLKFDNATFEKNVKTSITSIEKLNKSLNMEGAAKSLDSLKTSANSFNMDGLNHAAESIASRFTTMGIVGVTALVNIANQAINTGKQVINALTIDPIKMGFNEYELKMGSIQTIMAGTGESLKVVNEYLDELNTYSDKTIYSFADMTQNIGKFTNAGVKLDKAVAAIQGISNAAAVSGANAGEASRAMYNFAQALSAGYVKLIDWKSIENANMATVEFKQQLIDTAVATGKLTKTSDGYYKTLKGTVISATKNFNDSLQDQWMTSEVLIETLGRYADETTDIGKKAFAAAQDVKTLSQLYDTLKESAQSGWAQTWQIIIGDFEEAKVLMTMLSNSIGSVIGKSADARNEMLQGWKDLGGREALINGLTNLFKLLGIAVNYVSSAFKQVFPKTTGKQLADMSKAFENFTKMLSNGKLGTPINNLSKTFRGLFSIVSILVQILKAAGGVVVNFISIFHPLIYTFLEVTAKIGDYIYNLDQAMKKSGIFSTIVENISVGMAKLRDFLVKIKDAIKNFITTNDINLVIDFSSAFQFLSSIMEGIGKVIGKVVQAVMPLLRTFIEKVKETFGNLDFKNILSIVNGGIFATILLSFKKFIGKLSGVTDASKDILSSVKGIIDGVGDSLKAWQTNLKADTLFKIAAALGILTISVIALSMVDSDKLTSALVGMGVLFTQLIVSLKAFEAISSTTGFKGMTSLSIAMLMLSASILLLAFAANKLGQLDWNGLTAGLVGVFVLTKIMGSVAKTLSSTSGKIIKGTFGLILFSAAIIVLTTAVEKLAALNIKQLTKGLVGVGVLCLELAAFLKLSNFSGIKATQGVGLIALAGALVILSIAVERFGNLPVNTILNGLLSVGAILAGLAIFIKVIGKPSGLLTASIGITILSASMLIFAEAIDRIGAIRANSIIKGLFGIAFVLTAVTLAAKFMPKNMISIGIGMMGIAVAISVLTNALQSMGGMSLEEIGKGLLTLAGSLLILGVALNAMSGSIGGSAALLVAAVAIGILTPSLKALGKMSLKEIGAGLLVLAGSLLILGGAALVLAPIAPALLLVSVALGVLGVAILAIGGGLVMLASVLSIGSEAMLDMLKNFGACIPAIISLVVQLIVGIITSLAEAAPQIYNAVLTMISEFLRSVADNLPSIIDSGIRIALAFLQGIANNIEKFVTVGMDIIIGFIRGVTNKLPDLIDAGFKLVISFINGLADAIRTNTPTLLEAVGNLAGSIIEGLANGILGGIKKVGDSLLDVGKNALNGLKEFLGIHSPSTVLAEVGVNTSLGFANGMTSENENTSASMTQLAVNMLAQLQLLQPLYFQAGLMTIMMFNNGIRSQTGLTVVTIMMLFDTMVAIANSYRPQFHQIGVNMVWGFIEGVRSQIQAAAWAAAEMASAAANAAKAAFNIHSPSRVFAWIGKMVGLGLVEGIDNSTSIVENSANNLSNKAINVVNEALKNIVEIAGEELDNEPKIKPVLDLSNIERGSSSIKNLLSGGKFNVNATVDKANKISLDVAKRNESNNNDSKESKGDIYVEFKQTNNSPKALAKGDIYRNTNNALSRLKEGLTNI